MSGRAAEIAATASGMVTAAVVVRPASGVLYGRPELASSLDALYGVSTGEAAIPRTLVAGVLQQFPGGAALAAAHGRHSLAADQPRTGSTGAPGAGSVDSPDCRPAGDLGERGTRSRRCDRAEARGVRAARGRGPPPSAPDGVTAQETERSADPVSLPGRRAGRVWVCHRMCLTCSVTQRD